MLIDFGLFLKGRISIVIDFDGKDYRSISKTIAFAIRSVGPSLFARLIVWVTRQGYKLPAVSTPGKDLPNDVCFANTARPNLQELVCLQGTPAPICGLTIQR